MLVSMGAFGIGTGGGGGGPFAGVFKYVAEQVSSPPATRTPIPVPPYSPDPQPTPAPTTGVPPLTTTALVPLTNTSAASVVPAAAPTALDGLSTTTKVMLFGGGALVVGGVLWLALRRH